MLSLRLNEYGKFQYVLVSACSMLLANTKARQLRRMGYLKYKPKVTKTL